jgi:hypothetical protein
MLRRWHLALLAGLMGLGVWLGAPGSARAQDYDMGRFFYYPYYYFPHSYWPSIGKEWPERPGMPYQPPPAYMAYPPFTEPHWHYDIFSRTSYYRGFHFWLDAF